MNFEQALAFMLPNANYKGIFLLRVLPIMVLAREAYNAQHMQMGIEKKWMEINFEDPRRIYVPHEPKIFRACVVQKQDGQIVLTNNSLLYPEFMPEPDELKRGLSGIIEFLYEE